jgi:hypothetical protein
MARRKIAGDWQAASRLERRRSGPHRHVPAGVDCQQTADFGLFVNESTLFSTGHRADPLHSLISSVVYVFSVSITFLAITFYNL